MQDAHIVAGNFGGVGRLQHGRHLLHHIHRKGAGLVQVLPVGNGGDCAVGAHLGAVEHIGAGLQHIAGDGIQRHARLTAHGLGGLQHIVVNGGQIQHIGQTHEVAVLVHLCLDGRGAELPALGGNAFRQGLQGLGQAGVAPELDALAAVLGNGPLLAELAVNQVGAGFLDEGPVVKGLVFHGQGAVGGHIHIGIVRKQLKIRNFHFFSFHSPLGISRS